MQSYVVSCHRNSNRSIKLFTVVSAANGLRSMDTPVPPIPLPMSFWHTPGSGSAEDRASNFTTEVTVTNFKQRNYGWRHTSGSSIYTVNATNQQITVSVGLNNYPGIPWISYWPVDFCAKLYLVFKV